MLLEGRVFRNLCHLVFFELSVGVALIAWTLPQNPASDITTPQALLTTLFLFGMQIIVLYKGEREERREARMERLFGRQASASAGHEARADRLQDEKDVYRSAGGI